MTNQTIREGKGAFLAAATILSVGLAVAVASTWLWSTTPHTGLSSKKREYDEDHKIKGVMETGERTGENDEPSSSSSEKTISSPDPDSALTSSSSTPPATPTRQPSTSSTKGRKWRDRLSAKKQNKLKQHQKLRDQSLQQ